MRNFFKFLLSLWCLLCSVSILSSQDLKTLPTSEVKNLPTIKILNKNQAGNKLLLNDITNDSIYTYSMVTTTSEGFKLYAPKSFAINDLDVVKVTNKSRKLKMQLILGTVAGVAGAFWGRENIAREDDNVGQALLQQENDKTLQTIAGGVLGAGIGVTIGNFLEEKKVSFIKNRDKASSVLKKYLPKKK